MEYTPVHIESVSMWLDIVNDINKKLLESGDTSEKYFFRGQANNNWPVMPSVFRKKEISEGVKIDLLDYEDLLIKEMLRISQESFEKSRDNFEILTQLQHFSVPTRLMDITENPLVALYFACSTEYQWHEIFTCSTEMYECELRQVSNREYFNGKINSIDLECCPNSDEELTNKCIDCKHFKSEIYNEIKDGEIIVCKEKVRYLDDDEVRILAAFANFPNLTGSTLEDFLKFLDKNNGIKINRDYNELVSLLNTLSTYICVSPKLNNPRIQRQNGSFLICGTKITENFNDLSVKDLLNIQILKLSTDYRYEIEQKNQLDERYIIKHSDKQELLKQLNMLGINEGTLFPELEHQASYVKGIIHEKIRPKTKLDNYAKFDDMINQNVQQDKIVYPSTEEIISGYIANTPLAQGEKEVLTKTILMDKTLFKETDWFMFDSKISANNILLKRYFIKSGLATDAAKEFSDKIVETVKQKFISEAGE